MLQPATVRKIIKELGQLRADPPEGIRVQVDEEDVLQFVGIIAGPGKSDSALTQPSSLAIPFLHCADICDIEGTPYHGGYFKVRFTFGDEFPAAPPKCTPGPSLHPGTH